MGKPPFDAPSQPQTYKRIAHVDIQFPSIVPTDAQDLIRQMLQKNPHDRLPLKQVIEHPFILRCKAHRQKQIEIENNNKNTNSTTSSTIQPESVSVPNKSEAERSKTIST